MNAIIRVLFGIGLTLGSIGLVPEGSPTSIYLALSCTLLGGFLIGIAPYTFSDRG